MSYNFKTYSDLEIAENLGDSSYILVEENGEVKRFAAGAISAKPESLPLYNVDNLSRDEMIQFTKEYKEFRYLKEYEDDCNYGDITIEIQTNTSYTIKYDDDDSYTQDDGCGNVTGEVSIPENWSLYCSAFGTIELTKEEYDSIKLAWENMCVNA
jgi:hypothetical protein